MFIFHIPYRARAGQEFRREQLIRALTTIKICFLKYKYEFKIIICEQNNNTPFNRGMMFNVGFIESEKRFLNTENKYIQFNADVYINNDIDFPSDLLSFKNGFLEINESGSVQYLANCCIYDKKSYILTNGFPNDLIGWGGDDWAIMRRIKEKNVGIIHTNDILSKWVHETPDTVKINNNNDINIYYGLNNDIQYNGIDNCHYSIDRYGEFHDENSHIYHFLISTE
jgi:hypothetical protein